MRRKARRCSSFQLKCSENVWITAGGLYRIESFLFCHSFYWNLEKSSSSSFWMLKNLESWRKLNVSCGWEVCLTVFPVLCPWLWLYVIDCGWSVTFKMSGARAARRHTWSEQLCLHMPTRLRSVILQQSLRNNTGLTRCRAASSDGCRNMQNRFPLLYIELHYF